MFLGTYGKWLNFSHFTLTFYSLSKTFCLYFTLLYLNGLLSCR